MNKLTNWALVAEDFYRQSYVFSKSGRENGFWAFTDRYVNISNRINEISRSIKDSSDRDLLNLAVECGELVSARQRISRILNLLHGNTKNASKS